MKNKTKPMLEMLKEIIEKRPTSPSSIKVDKVTFNKFLKDYPRILEREDPFKLEKKDPDTFFYYDKEVEKENSCVASSFDNKSFRIKKYWYDKWKANDLGEAISKEPTMCFSLLAFIFHNKYVITQNIRDTKNVKEYNDLLTIKKDYLTKKEYETLKTHIGENSCVFWKLGRSKD